MRSVRASSSHDINPRKTKKREREKETSRRRSVRAKRARGTESVARDREGRTRAASIGACKSLGANRDRCGAERAQRAQERWRPIVSWRTLLFAREFTFLRADPYTRVIPLLVLTCWPNVACLDRRDISIARITRVFAVLGPSRVSLSPSLSLSLSLSLPPRDRSLHSLEEHSRRFRRRSRGSAKDPSRSSAIEPPCARLAAGVAGMVVGRLATASERCVYRVACAFSTTLPSDVFKRRAQVCALTSPRRPRSRVPPSSREINERKIGSSRSSRKRTSI